MNVPILPAVGEMNLNQSGSHQQIVGTRTKTVSPHVRTALQKCPLHALIVMTLDLNVVRSKQVKVLLFVFTTCVTTLFISQNMTLLSLSGVPMLTAVILENVII